MSFIKSPAMLTLILSVIVLILACVLVSRQSCNEHFFQTPPVPSDATMDAQQEAMAMTMAAQQEAMIYRAATDLGSRVGEVCVSDPDADICLAYNTYLKATGDLNNQSEDMNNKRLELETALAEAKTNMEAATSHFNQIKEQIANAHNLPHIRDASNLPTLESRFTP